MEEEAKCPSDLTSMTQDTRVTNSDLNTKIRSASKEREEDQKILMKPINVESIQPDDSQ